MQTALVILAAGMGSRMNSDIPKVLHEVAGLPLIGHAMRAGAALSPERTVVVTGHGADAVEAVVATLDPGALCVRQGEQLGTGHAVDQARAALADFDGTVIVLYGDTPFVSAGTLEQLVACRADADVAVLGFNAQDPARYGRLITEGDALTRIVEANERGLRATYVTCDETETMGVNDRAQLAQAEGVFQRHARRAAMLGGVTLADPDSVYFSHDTAMERDVWVGPNVVFGPGVEYRPLRPPQTRRGAVPRRKDRQFRRDQERGHCGRGQGQPPVLCRRRLCRGGGQYRRGHDHLLLRRRYEAPHRNRCAGLCRLMCGIVGVLGTHEVAPILVESLKRLEYRGYDSAGIATVNSGALDRRRAVGKLINLSDLLVHEPLAGKSGIGHTRWATHGAPSVKNAHPHQAGRVAVVHNGIIENFKELRGDLAKEGIGFETETDTETVVLLTQHFLKGGMSPQEAAFATLDMLEGAFALCFLFEGEDDLMIAARKGSPLAIGHGDGEMYVGSDAIALAPLTDRITYLAEGDRAVLTRSSLTITDASGRLANREVKQIQLDAARVEKGGHKHFMAKEIAEQPVVLADAIAAYTDQSGRTVSLPSGDLDFTACDRWISRLNTATATRRFQAPPTRSSSPNQGRPPTRWPRCAMRKTRPTKSCRWSMSPKARLRAKAIWPCQFWPAQRSA